MKTKKRIIGIVILLVILLGVTFGISFSSLVQLENGTRVQPNSDLIYYLNVSYDGVDRFGIQSSEDVIADVNSGVIYVQDTIPDGLIFNGFVPTEDGSIGAINEKTNRACLGKVVDDTDGTETLNSYHGLHYDESTRTVSFKVTNLQAGCVLTVGIKTITPEIDDPNTEIVEHRRDFYNFATSMEDDFYYKSNMVHAWMGIDTIPKYEVKYNYVGDVPDNVPELPETQSYVEGSKVALLSNPILSGYTFSGWSSSDVTVNNYSFNMPAKEVVFVGSFTEIEKYKVSYEIEGNKPEIYEIPKDKMYASNENVYVDTLKNGDIIDGYVFSGWKNKETGEIVPDKFVMGGSNVVLIGSFEQIKYTVTYKFYDGVLPDNSSHYLPSTQYYVPGTKVSLPKINNIDNFKFKGWYHNDNFVMPEENIVIYGEWEIVEDIFVPRINITINEEDDYLHTPGDLVNFTVTIYNDEDYPIHEVYVSNNLSDVKLEIKENKGELASNSMVLINEIPANSSVSYTSSYLVKDEDIGTLKNEVEIIGVLSEENRALDISKDYKDSDVLSIKSSIKVCNEIITKNDKSIFEYEIKGEDISENISLSHGECKIIYVNPGEYSVTQRSKEKYKISSIEGDIKNNGDSIIVKESEVKEVKYFNELIVNNPNTNSSLKFIILIGCILITFGGIYCICYRKKIE